MQLDFAQQQVMLPCLVLVFDVTGPSCQELRLWMEFEDEKCEGKGPICFYTQVARYKIHLL